MAGLRDYAVITGDTVYGIAGRFGVPIRTLIEVNDLAPPFRLRPGQRLAIPRPQEHVVKAGETVQSIARLYGVDQSTLIRVNDIRPPYVVASGERLRLPAPVETATAGPAPAAVPRGAMTVEELPPPGAAPRAIASGSMAPGSTAAGGARPMPVAPAAGTEALSRAPQVTTDPLSALQAGPLPLPAPPADRGMSTDAVSPTAEVVPETAVVAKRPTAATPVPARDPPQTRVAAIDPKQAVPTTIPQPPPLSADKFLWPVNGHIISGYGAKDGGLHNDGINIAAPFGTPVRAAESGVVAYAGNELRGFGKLLLIRHADGWISAYAHNDTLLVKRGDRVTRGQVIARVGSSGSVSSPQLHFELRQGTRTVDPLSQLGAQGAALSPAASPGAPPDLG